MLHRRWEDAGYTVHIPDPDHGASCLGKEQSGRLLRDSAAVVLCVPCAAMEEVSCLSARQMDGEQLLMDISSVKVLPMRWMEQAYAGPVVGSHPLSGPAPGPGDTGVALVRGAGAGPAHAALRKGSSLI